MKRRRPGREEHGSRTEQKQHTRQALIDATLRLLGDKSFDGLSLREVTREVGIVPTAFYRHFATMEELGLVLVDESFRTMRRMLRAAREGGLPQGQIVHRSVETLVRYVRAHQPYFQFIARERFGGVEAIRTAIRAEIQLFVSELSTDLSRFPFLDRWSTEDLQAFSGLIVSAMIGMVEELIDLPARDAEREGEIIFRTEKQIRLIVLAVPHWNGKLGETIVPLPEVTSETPS
jgi:AcrR family transcriptional regulator